MNDVYSEDSETITIEESFEELATAANEGRIGILKVSWVDGDQNGTEYTLLKKFYLSFSPPSTNIISLSMESWNDTSGDGTLYYITSTYNVREDMSVSYHETSIRVNGTLDS